MFGGRANQAYDVAREALTIVRSHVDECNRREDERDKRDIAFMHRYDSDTKDLSTAVERLKGMVNKMFWAGAISFITVLLGIIGYLLVNGLPYRIVTKG